MAHFMTLIVQQKYNPGFASFGSIVQTIISGLILAAILGAIKYQKKQSDTLESVVEEQRTLSVAFSEHIADDKENITQLFKELKKTRKQQRDFQRDYLTKPPVPPA